MENYKKYEKMICKKAWQTARKFGLDFEDMRSEAHILYCEALKKHDPEKADFSTFLFWQLKQLSRIAVYEYRKKAYEIPETTLAENDMISAIEIRDAVRRASQDVQAIMDKFKSGHFEVPTLRYRGISYSRLRMILKLEGWEQTRIDTAVREMAEIKQKITA